MATTDPVDGSADGSDAVALADLFSMTRLGDQLAVQTDNHHEECEYLLTGTIVEATPMIPSYQLGTVSAYRWYPSGRRPERVDLHEESGTDAHHPIQVTLVGHEGVVRVLLGLDQEQPEFARRQGSVEFGDVVAFVAGETVDVVDLLV